MKQGPKEFLESKIKKLGTTEMAGIALSNVSLSINPTKDYYKKPEPIDLDPESEDLIRESLDVSNDYPIFVTDDWLGSCSILTFYRSQGKIQLVAQATHLPFENIEEETVCLQRALLSLCKIMDLEPGPIHLQAALVTMNWEEALPLAGEG